jgi:hypothetical protein
MRWLLRQIPPGWQLEHIVAGASGMYGALCLQCPTHNKEQQQQQQHAGTWMAAVWDGVAWHSVGTYGM